MNNNVIQIVFNADTAQAASSVETFVKDLQGKINEVAKVGDFATDIFKKMAAALSVGAVIEFTDHVVEAEAELQHLREKSSLAVETLSALSGMAKANKLSFEGLSLGLGLFNDKIFMAARNGGEAAQMFQDLGIDIFDAQGHLRATEDIFTEFLDRISKMPDGPNKVGLVMQALGRSAREMIPFLNQGAAGLEQMKQKMEAKGTLVTTEQSERALEFERSISRLKGSLTGVIQWMGNSAVPTLNQWVKEITSGIQKTLDFAKGNTVLAESLKAVTAFGVAFALTSYINSLGSALTLISLMGAQLDLIVLKNLAAWATSPVVAYAAALALVYEAFMVGVRAFELYDAKKKEALSVENVLSQNEALAKSISDVVAQKQKDGEITQANAAQMRRLLNDALALNNAGKQADAFALLRNLGKSLVPTAPAAPAAPAVPRVISDQDFKIREERYKSELKLHQDLLATEEAQLDYSYKRRLISTDEYFKKRHQFLNENSTAEAAAAGKDLQLVENQLAATKENPEKQKALVAQRQKILDQIKEINLKHVGDAAKLNAEEFLTSEEQAKAAGEMQVTIAENTGQKLLAAQLRIRQEFDDYRKKMQGNANAPSAESINAAERAALAQAEVADQAERAARAADIYQSALTLIDAQLQTGQLTASEAEERKNAAAKQYLETLQAELAMVQQIAEKNPGLDGVKEKLAAIRAEIAKTNTAVSSPTVWGTFKTNLQKTVAAMGTFAQQFGNLMSNTLVRGVDALADSLTQAIMGTKSLGAAMQEMAAQMLEYFISSMLKILLWSYVVIPVLTWLGVLSGGATVSAGTTAVIAAAAAVPGIANAGMGHADGGLIRGPGGSRDDLIPARLSNFEFVIPAMRVNEFGADFFEGIRTGAITAQDLYHGVSNGLATPVTSTGNIGSELPGLVGARRQSGSYGNGPAQSPIPHVIIMNSVRDYAEWHRTEGVKHTAQWILNNKAKLGLKS